MRRKKIYVMAGAFWILLSFLSGCLTGCRGERPPATAEAVLRGMCDAGVATDGQAHAVYDRAADPAGGRYLSDTLFSALYGEAARGLLTGIPDAPAAIGDAVICLSVAPTPRELAVFRCSDERGCTTAVGLCRARLDAVRRAWVGTEWEAMTEGGTVTVVGSYVLLVITEDPDRALDAARAVIRRGGNE